MTKCIFSAPVTTQSGYGARSRDFIRTLIKVKPNWDIKIIPQRWGNTPQDFLKIGRDDDIINRLMFDKNISQPDVWIQCTVPNEFQRVGKQLNIGLTAGIETTKCSHTWLEGCNKMDVVIVSSNHAKEVFFNSEFQVQHKQTKQISTLKFDTQCEVLFEGIDKNIYNTYNVDAESDIQRKLNAIKEDFCFLFTGHWLNGDLGHDRKNVGLLVKMFLDATLNMKSKPALILNSVADNSEVHIHNIREKINQIKSQYPKNSKFAKIYVIGGNLTDTEINTINNHKKVKAFISLTKGEGYGRPMAEFSATGKPIIATNWSGHVDYLDAKYTTLLNGHLDYVHPSAVWNEVILPDSKWFNVNMSEANETIRRFASDKKYYHHKLNLAKKQQVYIDNFTLQQMEVKLSEIIKKFPISEEVAIDLDAIS